VDGHTAALRLGEMDSHGVQRVAMGRIVLRP
jgi:hypothetical protein